MGKFINLGYAKLGEVGRLGGAIITGANLKRAPEKPKAPEADPADPPEVALATRGGGVMGRSISKGSVKWGRLGSQGCRSTRKMDGYDHC